MAHTAFARLRLVIVTAVLAAGAARGAAQDCAPCIADPPRLFVAADGTTAGLLTVCNRGATPVNLVLAVSDFSAGGADDKPFALGTTRHLSPEAPEDRDIVAGAAALGQRCVKVKLEVSGIWQSGLSRAAISDGGKELAQVHALRRHAPFNLKVDGLNPEKAEVRVGAKTPFELRLRNEDDMGYRFRWRLELPGWQASGVDYVRPNRSVTLTVPAARSPVSRLESGFLRSATLEGRLVVEYEPDPGLEAYALPQRSYLVHATVSWFGPAWQKFWNSVWTAVLLILGIGTSLLIGYALPMQRRRVAAKQRLALLEGRLAGLGRLVPARILALLRVEKRRLGEELRDHWPIDPTTEAALPKLEAQIDWIDRRISLVASAGEHMTSLADGTRLAVPQSDQVRAACRTVFEVVAKAQAGDDDIKRAQTALALVAELRTSAGAPPSDVMLQAVRDNAAQVRGRIAKGANPAGHEAAFEALVRALTAELSQNKLDAMGGADYHDKALTVARAEVVADFKQLLETSPCANALERRTRRTEELMAALCPGPEESLDRARTIVCEAEQGVSEADLAQALPGMGPSDLWIDVDPPKPLPYQLVSLRVRMRQPGLDDAFARSRIECAWSVNDGDLESDAWDASYFFFEPKTPGRVQTVLARLTKKQGLQAPAPLEVVAKLRLRDAELATVASAPVIIEPRKSYASASIWLSLGTLFTTMLLVGLGLVAGAQDKIQTLDWVAGAFTILALGFGADVLKRVLTRP